MGFAIQDIVEQEGVVAPELVLQIIGLGRIVSIHRQFMFFPIDTIFKSLHHGNDRSAGIVSVIRMIFIPHIIALPFADQLFFVRPLAGNSTTNEKKQKPFIHSSFV